MRPVAGMTTEGVMIAMIVIDSEDKDQGENLAHQSVPLFFETAAPTICREDARF